MRIIKIHGCSGAGKTTAVRTFMRECGADPIYVQGSHKVEAYCVYTPLSVPTYVLGSYENTCGGMDTITDVKDALALIDKYAAIGDVIHEGLLQSTYYGVMGEHSKTYGDNYLYAFLDTPVELCIQRVVDRRARANNTRPFNPDLTRAKHNTIERLKARVKILGHNVATIRHDGDMTSQLMLLLHPKGVQ